MSRALHVMRTSPGLTVQDRGRLGYLSYGISRGGAADPIALAEGAALLGQDPGCAAIEMVALGGTFESSEDMRIALTGAPMRATIDGETVVWNASHVLREGAVLTIGAAETGVYGYLSVGGGLATDVVLGSRSVHLSAGVGGPIKAGAILPVGPDAAKEVSLRLTPDPRFGGGVVRMVPSLQTPLFEAAEIARFEGTLFRRDVRSNRMGARLQFEGDGFAPEGGLSILSEVIVPGDVQISGDGTPFVLLGECQTVGGYPRIGSILPSDLPRVAQAPASADLRFKFVTLAEATDIEARAAEALRSLRKTTTPLVRDPRTIRDLLSYQLIDGVVNGSAGQDNL